MILKKISVALFSVLLISCSSDSDLDNLTPVQALDNVQTKTVSTPEFIVENGYFNFASMESFNTLVEELTNKSEDELVSWSKTYGVNSLLQSYKNIDANSILLQDSEEETDECTIPNRMANNVFASLYNSNGLLVINDTIFKVIDEYVYSLASTDKSAFNQLLNEPSNYQSIPGANRFKHTQRMELATSTRSVSGGDRSYVIDVSGSRREYANFEVSQSAGPNGFLLLDISLVGRAQKKHLWWGSAFDDEFVIACFECKGGKTDGYLEFDGFKSAVLRGVTRVSASKSIGLGHLIHNISTTVTFSFTKNVKKPDETYTNEYYIKN